jgi:hypothetical protein
MVEYHRVPSTYLTSLEHPRCPACVQVRMLLSKVEPGPAGSDRRTFECQKCGHVCTRVLSNDPMNSSVTGWLSGELRSPH